ncbi:hypothetical protein NOR_06866 [Metarhizium rileyi]|uniref:Uncharacterized protein n=1 Tax=Metarhizium rileyi (strain RCEF 4871) TaxID=1649241 RepID=A0A166ZPI1_METRR|nr:hypothetical protein NOR_06866 [Metarhizium rileyi RCEF 4871]
MTAVGGSSVTNEEPADCHAIIIIIINIIVPMQRPTCDIRPPPPPQSAARLIQGLRSKKESYKSYYAQRPTSHIPHRQGTTRSKNGQAHLAKWFLDVK